MNYPLLSFHILCAKKKKKDSNFLMPLVMVLLTFHAPNYLARVKEFIFLRLKYPQNEIPFMLYDGVVA